jgi:hypothetical protein
MRVGKGKGTRESFCAITCVFVCIHSDIYVHHKIRRQTRDTPGPRLIEKGCAQGKKQDYVAGWRCGGNTPPCLASPESRQQSVDFAWPALRAWRLQFGVIRNLQCIVSFCSPPTAENLLINPTNGRYVVDTTIFFSAFYASRSSQYKPYMTL